MGRYKWSAAEEQMIRELYPTLGPAELAAKMGVSYAKLVDKALRIGVAHKPPQVVWTTEMVKAVQDHYLTGGAKALAKELGLKENLVRSKARKLGLFARPYRPARWTDERLSKLHRLWPTASREILEQEVGLPWLAISYQARRLGLKGRSRSIVRANNNKLLNIRYFDTWTSGMAYTLGLLFADGSIRKRLTTIVVALAPSDISIIEFIMKEVRYTGKLYTKGGSVDEVGHKREGFVWLALRSKILAQKAFALGLKPRKTYLDEPFPSVPVEMLPHFIRGYFDGDGTAYRTTERRWNTYHQRCRISFIGTPKFIQGLHGILVQEAVMNVRPVKQEQGKAAVWTRVSWGDDKDLQKFYNYIYPPNYPFCLERKRRVIADWLSQEAQTIRTNPK